MKLLVADSNQNMVEMIASWLTGLGHEVYRAYNEEQVRIKWIEHQLDLVIIDNNLGYADDSALCRKLQSINDILVLVLSEGKDARDEIRCLEAGADDYLRKPFFPDQLLAHVHALSRRLRTAVNKQSLPIVHVGPLQVDLLHNEVHIHNKSIRLTPTESKLLHFLAINAGHVCAMDQIVRYVWEYSDTEVSDLVKPHIYNLRQKIEANPQAPRYIVTVPNAGYMLVNWTEEKSTMTSEAITQPISKIS